MIRPDALAALRRWREAIIAGCVIVLGLWLGLSPGPVVEGVGYVLALIGVLMMILALRRIRFARPGDGPGVVTLDEGRIAYLGPYYGGAVAIRDMTRLSLRRATGGQTWVLTHPEGVLAIPVNALGADQLFDAFSALDGLNMPHLLRALRETTPGTVTLWQADRPVALT